MSLLESAARVTRERIIAVATFDHGTGEHARRAVALVRARCEPLGIPFVTAESAPGLDDEAAWRTARWSFLRAVARGLAARDPASAAPRIATAHTLDDQLETVAMRALRGAGARGLAGLYARSDIVRPLLRVRRHEIAASAQARGVRWVDDPGNESRRHLRNRLRHELLPALERVRPGFSREMLDLSREAAEWRAQVEQWAEQLPMRCRGRAIHVASDPLLGYASPELAVLWPALAARAGVRLDRRGTDRLVRFTKNGVVGARIQLAGDVEVWRRLDEFVFARRGQATISPRRASDTASATSLELRPGQVIELGSWRFRENPEARDDAWSATLPQGARLTVREWRDGDRMRAPGGAVRRVKRFFGDASVPGADRRGWPVVLVEDEIVWIPGVRRSDAATVRSGRPGVRYSCERFERSDD